MKTQVLKPGLLVSLATRIKGGVNYKRVDIDPEHKDETGALRAKWETEREIPDPVDYENATTVRGKCRSLITAVCATSSFGLLCPQANEEQLTEAIEAARAVAAEHNRQSSRTQVEVYVLTGRVAQDDVEAARAIGAEVRELIDAMQDGIAKANPEAIREAANKAKGLGSMLSPDVSGKVSEAITQARKAAREIVKRVEKAGESAADVVAECNTDKLKAARFAFLDLDEGEDVTAEAPTGRGVDLEPESASTGLSAAPSSTSSLELF